LSRPHPSNQACTLSIIIRWIWAAHQFWDTSSLLLTIHPRLLVSPALLDGEPGGKKQEGRVERKGLNGEERDDGEESVECGGNVQGLNEVERVEHDGRNVEVQGGKFGAQSPPKYTRRTHPPSPPTSHPHTLLHSELLVKIERGGKDAIYEGKTKSFVERGVGRRRWQKCDLQFGL